MKQNKIQKTLILVEESWFGRTFRSPIAFIKKVCGIADELNEKNFNPSMKSKVSEVLKDVPNINLLLFKVKERLVETIQPVALLIIIFGTYSISLPLADLYFLFQIQTMNLQIHHHGFLKLPEPVTVQLIPV